MVEIDRRQMAMNAGGKSEDGEEERRAMLSRLMELRKQFGKNISGIAQKFREPIKEDEVESWGNPQIEIS